MSVASGSIPRSWWVTTISGRRRACHKPAMNRPRALPERPDTATSVSGLSVSAAMRRRSAASDIRATILGIRFSMTSISRKNAVHNSCSRLTLDHRERYDSAAPALNFGTADDSICNPVGSLNENIGANSQDTLEGRILVERTHEIHHLQPGEQFGAMFSLREP